MDMPSTISCFSTCSKSSFPRSSPKPFLKRNLPTVPLFRAASQLGLKSSSFLLCKFWCFSTSAWLTRINELLKFVDFDDVELPDTPREAEKKLSKTQEWILGDEFALMNKKTVAKVMQNDSDRRKKLNLLRYEFIGTACSGYCLIALSVKVAISYAIGVLFCCLYLQLLYQHPDNLSKDMIPPIFMQKKPKNIAVSSSRLVILAAIYGLWVLSHQYFSNDLVLAMFGMLVYKAPSLVQVCRDNEDLQFIFPEKVKGSND
ncbi:hypothetical protein P3X46_009827 [Hevea brasiliensis]|uniref:PRA1 family protein n=1 Tax=Hevea brasiliensis TaxID=3981 RepID=A0ABQ9MCQ9_HEVBR|nr:hypothetical protein P3X46_009827 [Hevea brasiliensis]